METGAAMTDDELAQIDWSVTTWKGSRLEQHRKFYDLPFRRKLEIIEGLSDFARTTREDRRKQGLPCINRQMGQAAAGLTAREEPPLKPLP
jgi:hypothetical protein